MQNVKLMENFYSLLGWILETHLYFIWNFVKLNSIQHNSALIQHNSALIQLNSELIQLNSALIQLNSALIQRNSATYLTSN